MYLSSRKCWSVRGNHGDRVYLDDGLGQRNVVLHVERLHPSLLLLVQQLTQLSGHFSLQETDTPQQSLGKKMDAPCCVNGHDLLLQHRHIVSIDCQSMCVSP